VVVTLTSAPGVDLVNTATASGGQLSPCPECTSTDTADASVPNPPAVVAATQEAVTDTSSGLAFTGAEVAGTSLLGLALIGAGLLLVGSKRRRRQRP
jgi:LPXTG-motif cell wall-anchored protein